MKTELYENKISFFLGNKCGRQYYVTCFRSLLTGCNRVACSEFKFPITKGWDDGTGLGTPNYGEILRYLLKNN